MDRIRAYVLRKFASTASLEVLRSPTYVEQVQEVIDRAAPIIREKLEEIRRPRGRRSRSVDIGWNDESFRRVREGRKHNNGDEDEESKERRNGSEREIDSTEQEETESLLGRNETILKKGEKKQRRRSVGSGRRSRRGESGGYGNLVDRIDDSSKHDDKSEQESDKPRDTLEGRLTVTQNILEDIAKSTSELGGTFRIESGEPLESEIIDHINGVYLPIVRPPSSKNSKSTSKNGTDSLTLPPISPEAPKLTKKKDELSLPVLSGSHSVKSHEQDASKDVEEASTMRDITSDIEDIAILPEDDHVVFDVEEDSGSTDLIPDIRTFVNEETDKINENISEVLREDTSEKYAERRESLEKFKELELEREREKVEEVFKDSLNVTPEIDLPPRPDSLEPDEDKIKLENDRDPARSNRSDGLKDKLMEIEIVERNIKKALDSQQIATRDGGETTSQAEKSMTDAEINEGGVLVSEVEKTISEIKRSIDKAEESINEKEKNEDNDKKRTKLANEAEKVENIIDISDKTESFSNKAEKSSNVVEEIKDEAKSLTKETKNSSTIKLSEVKEKSNENERSMNGKLPNDDVEELAVKIHVEDAQSERSQNKNYKITKAVISEAKDDSDAMGLKSEVETANKSSEISESVAVEDETSKMNSPYKSTVDETRKKREADKLPTTSPLPAETPFAYILSEGSPCEIPDSVTTVIIPDRPCLSPVTLEAESHQLESTNQEEESIIRSDIMKNHEMQEKDHSEYEMEMFGEYIRPETIGLPADIDFMRGMKGAKSGQDVVAIIHQDLGKIKEEGEEEEKEEEKEEQGGEIDSSKGRNDLAKQEVVRGDEAMKLAGTLEDIVEREENEELGVEMNAEPKDIEKVVSVDVPACESLPDTTAFTETALIDSGRADVVGNTMENSSEESGSTQDNRTTTSSDVKESTASNRSVESLGRPVVPELNLDSLQDNSVSSFKMTANGTAKEDNGSPRESDATTSLIEPLTSDERLMNRLVLVDHEEVPAEQEDLSKDLQSAAPEADQLYQAEHAEYEWLEKDPLSAEAILEDEAKSQDSIGLMALPEDVIQVGPLLYEKEEDEKLNSEEEIARELIGSLNEEIELAKELSLKEESTDSGKSVRNNLAVDDQASQPLSVDEPNKEKECEIALEEFKTLNDDSTKIEIVGELNHTVDIRQNDEAEENIKIEKSILVEEKGDTTQAAPLAQFEQDELLEPNSKLGMTNQKITVESKQNTIDTDSSDNQERSENEKMSLEEVLENQSKDSLDKAEDLNKTQEESEEEKISEECKQEKLNIQEETVSAKAEPLEMTESKKDSINELNDQSIESDKNDLTNHEKSVISEEKLKDEKETTEEKTKDLSAEGENAHKSITSAMSEQSMENHSHGGYWTTGTKSSTVETVIETVSRNTSTDKEVKADADASEIIDSLNTKRDEFYSAVIKIQACE